MILWAAAFSCCVWKMGTFDGDWRLCMGPLRRSKIRKRYTLAVPWDLRSGELLGKTHLLMLDGGRWRCPKIRRLACAGAKLRDVLLSY